MKKFNFYCILLFTAITLFSMSSCSKDENDSEPTYTDKVVINDDGTTSNGSLFKAIGDKSFYLDNIKYTVEGEHLVVSGFDGVFNAKIASSITYKQKSYDVLGISDSAFRSCKTLTSIVIPNGVTSIGIYAFAYCTGLTSITIPNSVTNIGGGAFAYCTGLTSITIPNSVTRIGDSTFGGCSGLTNITIPNSVTSIGIDAFSDCTGLTSITIPNSVTNIGRGAFSGCTGLTSITIPNSVTSIVGYAFSGCSGLTAIHCLSSTPPTIISRIGSTSPHSGAFDNDTYSKATLYVPQGSLGAYKVAAGWINFQNIIEE